MFNKNQVVQEVIMFVKRNKVICFISLLCIFVAIKMSKINTPIWMPKYIADIFACPTEGTNRFEVYSIIDNLALAFIGSVITYVFVEYIPQRKKAYKAFHILITSIKTLFSSMNELIMMFLFELEIDKDVGKISKVEIKKICELTLNDEIKNAKIDMYVDGNKQNVVTYGYDIYNKSTSLVKEIDINIQKIESTPCSESLDELLLDLISRVELNRFCNMIRQTKEPHRHIPGYEPIILQFDQGFYEFINIYLELAKFKFPHITYRFSKLSDEEMKHQREEILLTTTRAVFAIKSSDQVDKYVADVSALGVTEKNRSRINGVILEMIVCYDANKETHRYLLDSALKLASILIKYTPSGVEKDVYILNRYQIKARQNYKFSKSDKKEIQRIMKCKSVQNHIRLGAAILMGDNSSTKSFFEALSESEVQQFIQMPIYRLWINAPVAANDNPRLFIEYEHSNRVTNA